jgi:hypothetical protein
MSTLETELNKLIELIKPVPPIPFDLYTPWQSYSAGTPLAAQVAASGERKPCLKTDTPHRPVDVYLRSNSKLHFAAPMPPQSDTHDTSEYKNNRDTAKCCNIPYVSIVRSVRRGGCVPTPNNRAGDPRRSKVIATVPSAGVSALRTVTSPDVWIGFFEVSSTMFVRPSPPAKVTMASYW